jgi:phosphoribosylformylglycinamidine synthase
LRRYNIYITAKQGIFDPAGATAKSALDNLGFAGVASVSIGKYIQLETDDGVSHEEVARMCEKLLANPIIEDFRIEEWI